MNRLADQTSPYLRQHADNPGRLVPVGARRLRRRPAPGRARPAVDRLLGLPLVPRHGPRVLRGRRHGPGHERRLRQHQGRPRGAPRRRRRVHGGRPGRDRERGLADDGVPAAGRPAVPRRDLFPPQPVRGAARPGQPGLAASAGRSSTTPPTSWPRPSGPGPTCPVGAGRRRPAAPADRRRGRPPSWSAAADSLLARFDPEWGGFGRAPKFPQAEHARDCCCWRVARTGRSDLSAALTTTLDAMAAGGIYDHLGGGFARYSTDRRWLVPHFEKMLYDNAQLARVYLHACQLTGAAHYRQVVEETLGVPLAPPWPWPPGGWPRPRTPTARARRAASTCGTRTRSSRSGGRAAAEWYGVTAPGNWEGRNILFRPLDAPLARPPEVEAARQALLARRGPPGPARPGRQGAHRMERHGGRRPGRGRRARSAVRSLAGRRRGPGRLPARPPAAALGRPLAAQLAGGTGAGEPAAPATWPTPPITPGWSRPSPASPKPPAGPAGSRAATDAADALLDLFVDAELRRPPHDRPRRRAAHRPPHRQPGRRRAVRQLGRRRRPPAAGRPDRRGPLPRAGRGHHRGHEPRHGDRRRSPSPAWWRPPTWPGRGLAEVVVTGDRPDLVDVVRRRYLPAAVLAWGEAYPSPLWEGRTTPELAESGLRLPPVRLPGADGRRLHPGLAARRADPLAFPRFGHPPVGVLDWQL